MTQCKTSAAEVMRQHADLTTRWREPGDELLKFIEAFASDVRKKRGPSAAGSMFAPMTTTRIVEPWVREVGRDLFTARVFQVSAEMCDVTTALYQKTAAKVTRINNAALPARSGFAWLDEPVLLTDRRGKKAATRVMSWNVTSLPVVPGTIEVVPWLRVVFWADTRVADDFSNDWVDGVLKHSEKKIGRIQLQHPIMIPLDTEFTVESRFTSVNEGTSPLADNAVAWLHGLFMLLGTEVAALQPSFLHKTAAAAAKKRVKHPQVTVVTLRRASQAVDAVENRQPRDVDWSCCWLVQDHYRHLSAYEVEQHFAVPVPEDESSCAICGGRITWVKPHVKGPDGKPFKIGGTVYRLSR